MKQLVCEMCGGKDILKEDGVFVCQNCGMKYSVEEAKKMMIEIEGPVKVIVNKEKQTINALKLADDSFNSANYEQAQRYYSMVLEEDYNNAYATYMVGLCCAWQSTLAHFNAQALCQAMVNAKKMKLIETDNHKEIDKFCMFMVIKTNSFYLAFRKLAIQHYNKFNTLKDAAIDYYDHQSKLLTLQRVAIELLDESCLKDRENEENIKTAIQNTISSINEITRTFSYIDGVEKNGRDIYGQPMYQDRYCDIYASDEQLFLAGECQAIFDTILNNLPSEVKRKQETSDFFADKSQLREYISKKIRKMKSEVSEIDPQKPSGLSIFLIMVAIFTPFIIGGINEDLTGLGFGVGIALFVAACVSFSIDDKKKKERIEVLTKEIETLEKILNEPNKYKKEVEKIENEMRNGGL